MNTQNKPATSQSRKPEAVECYSLAEFMSLRRDRACAVISIVDEVRYAPDLDGWGPSLRCVFMDLEYESDRVREWGWSTLSRCGFFTPEIADRIRRFIDSEEVAQSSRLIVHCYAGQSRSVAVGLFASGKLGRPLRTTQTRRPNHTVLELLRNPRLYCEEAENSVVQHSVEPHQDQERSTRPAWTNLVHASGAWLRKLRLSPRARNP